MDDIFKLLSCENNNFTTSKAIKLFGCFYIMPITLWLFQKYPQNKIENLNGNLFIHDKNILSRDSDITWGLTGWSYSKDFKHRQTPVYKTFNNSLIFELGDKKQIVNKESGGVHFLIDYKHVFVL